ncbi:hypothetical protein SLA2020_418040 [Shorea laevis]
MVEDLVAEPGLKEFVKTLKEGLKKSIPHRDSNRFGRFLEVVVNIEGGRRSRVVILEGCKGQGWSRFVDELRKVKVFFEEMVGSAAVRMEPPLDAPSSKGKRWGMEAAHLGGERPFGAGDVPSIAEVVRTEVISTDKKRPDANGMLDSVISTRELDVFPLWVTKEHSG